MNYLLINDQLQQLKSELKTTRKEHFIRLIEQCRLYESEELPQKHPPTSITYMGMAAANLSLAYLLTKQEYYLTEAKRWSVDYLLTNSIAPSLDIPAAYKTEKFLTADGMSLSGIVAQEDDTKVILKTADNPRLEILKEDIEERGSSKLSLMPTGQLDDMPEQDLRDLMKYLQSVKQVGPQVQKEPVE